MMVPFFIFYTKTMIDEISKLLNLQTEILTELPAEFDFEARDTSMLPDGVTLNKILIYPLTAGTVFRITSIITQIDQEDLDGITVNKDRDYNEKAPELFGKYGDIILDAIALAIHNKKEPPPQYLKEFLQENCTWKDLHVLLNAILYRMGTLAFISSTTDMKKVGLKAEEIIALQKNLNSWNSSETQRH